MALKNCIAIHLEDEIAWVKVSWHFGAESRMKKKAGVAMESAAGE